MSPIDVMVSVEKYFDLFYKIGGWKLYMYEISSLGCVRFKDFGEGYL